MVEELKGWNKKLSYDFLIECAKNDKIDEWNMEYEAYLRSEWIRLFPSEVYDLENIGKLFGDDIGFERLNYMRKSFKDDISDSADLSYAHLEGANFSYAHLEGANFSYAHLEGANFSYTHLEGAIFADTYLNGAIFKLAVVNGETLFTYKDIHIYIDNITDFTGTPLSSARILPKVRTKLEKNIRQLRWEEWYKYNKKWEIPAKIFWKISDYGSSTRAVLYTFLFSNVIFMIFYFALRNADLLHGYILSPGYNLLLAYMQTTLVPFGILSIDLTTLSFFPVFIIFLQVIFGYTILAALVTRMAIMFQSQSS